MDEWETKLHVGFIMSYNLWFMSLLKVLRRKITVHSDCVYWFLCSWENSFLPTVIAITKVEWKDELQRQLQTDRNVDCFVQNKQSKTKLCSNNDSVQCVRYPVPTQTRPCYFSLKGRQIYNIPPTAITDQDFI